MMHISLSSGQIIYIYIYGAMEQWSNGAMEHVEHVGTWRAVKPDCPPPLWAAKGRLGKPCRHSFYSSTHTHCMVEL